MTRGQRRLAWFGVSLMVFLAFALPASAQRVKKRGHTFDDLAFQRPELHLTTQTVSSQESRAVSVGPVAESFDTLLTQEGVEWQLQTDRMTGLPDTMGGQGIPWIPGTGRGNTITRAQLGLAGDSGEVPVALVADKARDFIQRYPGLFGASLDELVLNTEGTVPMLDYLYYVQFHFVYQGVPVEHARVNFTLNHGNLIEVGQSNIGPAIRKLNARPSLDAETAWQILYGFLGEGAAAAEDEIREQGRLLIIPVVQGNALQGTPSVPGEGLGYRLVWVLSFLREGNSSTWEARVDAHSGEILSFVDANEYGTIKGGVYKTDKPFTEVNVPLPYANYNTTNPPTLFADAAGNFSGTTGTSTLVGQYVSINPDTCGAISLTADGAGLINFSTSGGLDCTTPGVGGSGNTHASRTQYWNVTQIKLKAMTYLTTNTWLMGRLVDRVNRTAAVDANCPGNAYWNGTVLSFCATGAGYWNTGELPGVSLHEFGHGMDSNDGNGGSPDNGSGETYGDITALLQTHSSCIGNGFAGSNCGYGADCTDCTGVRDLDYAKYTSPAPLTGAMLTTWCPDSATYIGPCGYEGHCESLISSQAVYDLAARDLITWGLDETTAWQVVDRLWYASRPTATKVYNCNTTTFATDGCGAGSLWRVFRAADDDDGNLNNGTPHMTALSAAFSRHLIACPGDAGYNTDSTICSTLPYSGMTAQTSGNQVVLNWNASTGAATYSIYRNETSCDAGYTKIATVSAPTTTYTDLLVASGITYFYRVQPIGSTAACIGPMSDCATSSTCAAPAAPVSLSATPNATLGIDLAWSSVAGIQQYHLYRRDGDAGGVNLLAVVSSSLTSYTDTALTTGASYTYAVRAFSACESLNSPQGTATAAGTCNQAPTFAGLTSATNPGDATCQVTLSWAAGASACGGSLTYSVYRSSNASFVPGPGYLIAQGVTGTSYTDLGTTYRTTYYYAVRATDSISGLSDANAVTLSAYPTGAQTTIYSNNFEANWTNWTQGTVQTPGATCAVTGIWERGDPEGTVNNFGGPGQPENAHSGTNCLVTGRLLGSGAGQYDVDFGEDWVRSPNFSAGSSNSVELDLWRWFLNDNTLTEPGCAYPDFWLIEATNNGGTSWTTLESLDESCSTESGCGTNAWINRKFMLEDYLPLTTTMGFRVRVADGQNDDGNGGCGGGGCLGNLVEGALDDVVVRGSAICTSCTPPATPTGLIATAGVNQVSLSWSAAAGAAGYTVFRSTGTCPGSAFIQIATGIATTSYSDSGLSSGQSYAYMILAYSATRCESGQSSCASAAPTGACSLPPTFAGVAAVSDSHSATCGIAVNWATGTAACAGGNLRYNIYRAASAAPVPGAATLLAKGVNGTSYNDTVNLIYGTVYYYVVRAEDLAASGAGPNGGTEETNQIAMASGASGGVIAGATVFLDDFETGAGTRGWATGFFYNNTGLTDDAVDWRGVQACASASGSNILRWGGTNCTGTQPVALYNNSVASLAYPAPNVYTGIDLPLDATNIRLTFNHRYRFAAGDGALLYLHREDDRYYYRVPKSTAIFLTGNYNALTSTTNVLSTPSTYDCWSGTNDTFGAVTVDLDAACQAIFGSSCAGHALGIAFIGSSNTSGQANGWFLDDVKVAADYGATTCSTVATCPILVQITPSSESVAVGSDILFSVSHSAGAGPYTYQWTQDGANIPGATSETLAINKSIAQSHTYNCKVTDASGACTNVTAATGATGTWTSLGGTAKAVPASVTPLRIVKNNGTATDLNVTWDATNCASTDYHIIWGPGANVATLGGATPTISGGKCDIGTGGALNNWATGVPTPASGQFVWFLVVGNDNASKEASWGQITGGAERGLGTASNQCSCTTKDTAATCGTP